MRLKAYTAATIAEAMQQIRDELGDDAAIVSTETAEGSVRVVAAVDPAEPAAPAAPAVRPVPTGAARTPDRPAMWPFRPAPPEPPPPNGARSNGPAALARALDHHGVPAALAKGLLDGAVAEAGPAAALAERMKAVFRFANLADRSETSPILLAGLPGAGKTLVAAKLAARAVLRGQPVRVITTDDSAGAIEQLTAFMKALDVQLETADGPAALARVVAQRPGGVRPLTLIDTRGVNPFDAVEMAGLAALIVASRADPALVLAAGGDAPEAAEMAEAFADIGCVRLIATRLDIGRRLGGLLAAAAAGRLAFAETGASPIVAHGVQPTNPRLLARLFVAEGRG
jgi:flagellar biosynthesis protein FlhF